MTTTTAADPAIERFLDETRDRRLDSYKELLRIPSISALPRARRRLPGDRGLDRRRARADRRRERVGRGDDGAPGRLRRLAPRRGRPDRDRLLPLRRPAGRPAGALGLAAVRAGRRRGQDARPRRGRRQGPAPPPAPGDRGDPRGARRAPGEPPVHLRGRRGVERGAPRRLARDPPRAARRRRRGHQRHGLLRGQPAGDHDLAAGHDVRPDRRHRQRGRPSLGRLRRRRRQPRQCARPDHHGAQGSRRPDPHPRLLRRRRRADR